MENVNIAVKKWSVFKNNLILIMINDMLAIKIK